MFTIFHLFIFWNFIFINWLIIFFSYRLDRDINILFSIDQRKFPLLLFSLFYYLRCWHIEVVILLLSSYVWFRNLSFTDNFRSLSIDAVYAVPLFVFLHMSDVLAPVQLVVLIPLRTAYSLCISHLFKKLYRLLLVINTINFTC